MKKKNLKSSYRIIMYKLIVSEQIHKAKMIYQKYSQMFEDLKKDVKDKTLDDFTKYIKDAHPKIDIESEIEKFRNMSIEKTKKKKVGKTTNYHRFMRIRIDELKDTGNSKQDNILRIRSEWKELSDSEKQKYDKTSDEESSNDDKKNDSESD